MKLFAVLFLLILSFNVFAQKTDELLATTSSRKITVNDLPPELRQAFASLPKTLADTRTALLNQQINDELIAQEAAARKVTVEDLIQIEVRAKNSAPTDAEIKAVYDANRANIGSQTLEEIRPQIVSYLKRDAEQKAYANLISTLKTKYKVAPGKDVNAPNLTNFEILATVGGKQISAENFKTKNKIALSDFEVDAYEQLHDALEQVVYSDLILTEAKAQNLEASDLIAREITDKLKDYSNEERARLEQTLRDKLFKKYNAKILLKEVAPIVQNIATEGSPAQGKATAPVTIVMFSDFQCSACSGTHPVLKRVIAEYTDKIRFVVRDFPLAQIHENAYQSALAAGAANAQGKFFEYIEVLYQNQSQLDAVSLRKYANDLGLNLKQFETDATSKKIADEVQRDIEDGKRYGITGTPTIYVNGVKVRSLSEEGFRDAIERALKK